MSFANPLRSYQRVSTETASAGHLVLMLFDGAIRFLGHALSGFEHGDPLEFNAGISNNIIRAQEIIEQLNNSLDLEQGGELASTLRRLYYFMDGRLTESNVTKTRGGIEDTLQRLTTLREAWSTMLTQQPRVESVPAGHTPLYAHS